MDINKTTAPKETIYAPFKPDEEAPYIFVSYSHRDRERVFPIITRLYEKGWRIWYDEGLEVTENYYTSLSRHIKNCTVFLLFVTENSVKSEFVSEHELLLATTMRKRIAICQLDKNAEFEGEAKDAIDIATVSKKNPKTDEAGLETSLEGIEELPSFAPRKAEGFKVQAHQVEILEASSDEDEFEFVKCEGGVRLTDYVRHKTYKDDVVIPKKYKGLPVVELGNIFYKDGFVKSVRIPPTVRKIANDAFVAKKERDWDSYERTFYLDIRTIDDLYIPSSVKELGFKEFYGTVHCAKDSAAHKAALSSKVKFVLDPSLDIDETIQTPAANGGNKGDRYVFCSYAEDNKEDAERIIRRLKESGCSVADCASLSRREINKRYRDAGCMIAFLSQEYIDEDWIDFMYRAIAEDKPFIIYALDGSALPDDIDIARIHDQQLRFDNGTEADRIAKLIEWLDKNNCISNYSPDIPDFEYSTDKKGDIFLTKYTGKDKEIVIPSSFNGRPVVGIIDELFYKKKLDKVTIPSSIWYIGNKAFSGCGLTELILPEGVGIIGKEAFADNNFVSLSIPESVKQIDNDAFLRCNELTSLSLLGGRNISYCAFSNCSSLVNINVSERNTVYDSRKKCNAVIKTETDTLIFGCCNTVIPDSVKHIGFSAFFNCTGLTSIEIPNSVTSIGDSAFEDCTGLTSITIPDSVTSIGYKAFSGCSHLTHIKIGDHVTSIGRYAFSECTSLTHINIGDSVTSIDDMAFSGCSALTHIEIPHSVTNIGANVFKGCTALTSLDIPKSVTYIGDLEFKGFTELMSVTLPDSVNKIYSNMFEGCTSLKDIQISDSVTVIAESAFKDCKSLKSINIPDSVDVIEDYAFSGCTSLEKIIIPEGITRIGEHTYGFLSGHGVLGRNVFEGCTNLKSVTLPSTATRFWEKALGYTEDRKVKINGFTIYGYKDSEAEKYAEDNGFSFITLD